MARERGKSWVQREIPGDKGDKFGHYDCAM